METVWRKRCSVSDAPCARPDPALGQRSLADVSAITLVLQGKDVEGLQVLNDNQWFKVPLVPETLVVNVGDPMQVTMKILIRQRKYLFMRVRHD